jgi:CheY-like chemotaxis protein
MNIRARARGIELRIQSEPDVPRAILADPVRLRQILLNLVSNAIKFTEQGGVVVRMQSQNIDGVRSLRVAVRDSGIGITTEQLSKLFQPFSQADGSMTRRFGGTGLGLAICKGLVEQMGGAIQVTSTLGEGTTFTFDLHLELAASPESVEQLPAVDSSEDLAGLRVLVVDDNPLNRMLMERQLAMLGASSPAMAESGLQALAMVLEAPFDVVLMDMQMPDLDGLETTRRLRELQIPVQPWVIGVTANAFVDDRLACLDAGMDDFLSKPVSMTTLNASLRSVSRQSGTSSPN